MVILLVLYHVQVTAEYVFIDFNINFANFVFYCENLVGQLSTVETSTACLSSATSTYSDGSNVCSTSNSSSIAYGDTGYIELTCYTSSSPSSSSNGLSTAAVAGIIVASVIVFLGLVGVGIYFFVVKFNLSKYITSLGPLASKTEMV
jgi:hypothetical protein